ncbi:MAG: PKD domain-containing protein [Xanthomonadales bacterium]|nr:PKD domain-containing protein [Xanthomonadales bacterium]
MLRILTLAALAVCMGLASAAEANPPGLTAKQPLPKTAFGLPSINKDALIEQDLASRQPGAMRYGIKRDLGQTLVPGQSIKRTEWTDLGDGRLSRRWLIDGPNSESLEAVLSSFWVPNGVELYFYDPTGEVVRGPFTDQHNTPSGVLPLPFVPGSKGILELVAPAEAIAHIQLELGAVIQAYRPLWDLSQKSGSCNVDTICPQGDPWRDQIASVAHYTTSGFVCTGQLINAVPTDARLFLTANHCVSTNSEVQGMVFYFNFESDTCREPGSAASGTALSRNNFPDTISGASLVSTSDISDFTLVRMSQEPPASYEPYWTGWDRSTTAPASVTAIHHPAGHAKRISFEDDPLCTSPYLEACGTGDFWRVEDWDLGTTEGGSSGSGIWNPQQLLIGQLRGGFAACGNDDPDWYGRFDVSWTGGGTPNTRLSDWLDPDGTDPQQLEGTAGCDAPNVSINSASGVTQVGQLVSFSANVSGGQAPYTYAWDFDGDGQVDSTAATGQAQYHEAFSSNVNLRVTDSTSCAASATFGLVAQGPSVVVAGVGTPAEVCGDGDAELEPGESWSFPVTLRNTGNAAANNGFAAFAVGPAELSPLSFAPNSTFPALDDGAATVSLGGPGFPFYGSTVDTVAMSSNGYLSTDPTDNGEFFGNVTDVCPIPSVPQDGSTTGGRILPFHADLIISQGLHRYYSSCPRPSGSGGVGCNVFQWDDTGFFGSADVSFDIQVVLYDNGDIVYQYDPGNLGSGFGRGIGIQNPGATDGLGYSCSNNPNPTLSNLAVCFNAPATGGKATGGPDTFGYTFSDDDEPNCPADLIDLSMSEDIEGVVLENGALPIGTLNPNQTVVVDVVVQVDPSFACGGNINVDYLGTGHDNGFSNTPERGAITTQAGGSACNVNNQCPATGAPTVQPQQGFWLNALRPGNGIDIHFNGTGMYSAWYTAGKDRLPTWYYVQTRDQQQLANNQLTADILRFSLSGDITQTPPTFTQAGTATFSFIDDSRAVMTWTIDGESSGEIIQFFELAGSPVDGTLTDQYFNSSEPGWGLGLHRQGNQEFTAIYFYDTAGNPRWVVVTSDGTVLVNQGTADVSSARAHCPGCVWTPVELIPGGTMTRTLNGDGSSVLDSLDVSIQSPIRVEWQRSNLPLQQILPE